MLQKGARFRRCTLHLYRVGVFVVIMLMIRQQHQWYRAQQQGKKDAAVTVDRLLKFYPAADRLTGWNPSHGGRIVADANGRPLGYVVQTSPASDFIVGYSGPNNTLIALDTDNRVLGIELLDSGDTPEHAQDVVEDEAFMRSWNGLTWQEVGSQRRVDGVSGATLTSLAMAEGIAYRLSGSQPSYRFPEPVRLAEVVPLLPGAERLATSEDRPRVREVLDAQGQTLGSVLRTAPTTDDLVGYQGPTDTLIALDPTGRVAGIALRKSFDNEEYVQYVVDDTHFLGLFNGKTIDELGRLDLEEAQIEGVSGATMTSLAVAQGLIKTAQTLPQSVPKQAVGFTVKTRDIGTASVVVLSLLLAGTSWRGNSTARIAFQLLLIVYLGFINGDMLSQALLVGCARNGLPWRFAPGLVLLSATALIVPIVSRKQPYCHHICPFGAAQQLTKNLLPLRLRLPRWLMRCLQLLPALLLLWVLLVAMLHWPFSLTSIEPFDAFMIRVAGLSTIVVAIVGLSASLVMPMVYCRVGCPTGAVLNYLRFNSRSDQFTYRDWVALAFVGLVFFLRLV